MDRRHTIRALPILFLVTGCSNLLGLDDYEEQAAAATTGAGGSGAGGENLGGGGSGGGPSPVQCNGDLLLRDQFERRVPEGWGTPDVGMPWSTNGDSSTSVADGSGTVRVATTDGHAALVIDAAPDVEMVGTIGWTIPASSFTLVLGGLMLRASFSDYITASIVHEQTQPPYLEITYVTAAIGVVLDRVDLPTGSWSENGFFVRFQAFGSNPSTLRARVWPRGEEEPSEWLIEVMNSDQDLPQSGGYGAQAYTEGNTADTAVLFDRFTVCSL